MGDIVGEGVVEERTSAVIVIEKLPALSSIAASMSQKLKKKTNINPQNPNNIMIPRKTRKTKDNKTS